jgi:hypothetical protein
MDNVLQHLAHLGELCICNGLISKKTQSNLWEGDLNFCRPNTNKIFNLLKDEDIYD